MQPGPVGQCPGQDNVRVVYVSNAPVQTGCCGKQNTSLMSGTVTVLSVILLVSGFICIIANSFDMAYGCWNIELIFAGAGISTGCMFILTGCFGLAAAQTKLTGWIVTLLIFSIISALHTIWLISFASIEISEASEGTSYSCAGPCGDGDCPEQVVSLTFGSLQLICALVGLAVTVLGSIMSCQGADCCCRPTYVGNVQAQSLQYPVNQVTYIHQTAPVGPAYPQVPAYPGYAVQVSQAYPAQYPGVYTQTPPQGMTTPPDYSSKDVQRM